MAGRHERAGSTGRLRRGWVVAAVLLVVAAGTAVALVWNSAASQHDSNGRQGAGACAGLHVVAAPSIAPAITAVADQWTAKTPTSLHGKCVSVTVNSVDSATEAANLTSGPPSDVQVWIPDSRLWAARVPTAAEHVGAPIASTPLVLVASPARAATLPPATTGWGAVVAGKLPALVPDPIVSTEGALGVLALRSVAGTGSKANGQLVGVMVALSHAKLANAAAGFTRLAAQPVTAPIFLASEQEVIVANRSHHSTYAAAMYPGEGTLSLDYPVVRLPQAGRDSDRTAAATAFEAQLRTAAAQTRLAADGFRDASGHPIPGVATRATGSASLRSLPAPTPAQADQALRMWSAASEDSRLLAVIDVSGSMKDVTANGQTKIQLVVSAALAASGFFPPGSDLGLWAFSTDQTATTDWAELVPLGPIDAKLGSVTRRQALLVAANSLPSRVRGNTALYNTTLAAFEDVRTTYNPSKVNSVVIMTDGRDVHPGGISLDQLLAALRAQVDPARPIPIITIGVGKDVDAPALRAISALTGGKTYIVTDPTQIRGVFLDAILQRECRPTC
jgi:ABC-type sulfate transport system substrate-binding protein